MAGCKHGYGKMETIIFQAQQTHSKLCLISYFQRYQEFKVPLSIGVSN